MNDHWKTAAYKADCGLKSNSLKGWLIDWLIVENNSLKGWLGIEKQEPTGPTGYWKGNGSPQGWLTIENGSLQGWLYIEKQNPIGLIEYRDATAFRADWGLKNSSLKGWLVIEIQQPTGLADDCKTTAYNSLQGWLMIEMQQSIGLSECAFWEWPQETKVNIHHSLLEFGPKSPQIGAVVRAIVKQWNKPDSHQLTHQSELNHQLSVRIRANWVIKVTESPLKRE